MSEEDEAAGVAIDVGEEPEATEACRLRYEMASVKSGNARPPAGSRDDFLSRLRGIEGRRRYGAGLEGSRLKLPVGGDWVSEIEGRDSMARGVSLEEKTELENDE